MSRFVQLLLQLLQTPDVTREQQLTEDLIEILTVFSSRLYGSRSRKNLRALAAGAALPA
jgi:predicted site-specific integrase-resolvase